VFTLDTCDNTEEYRTVVGEFWSAVKADDSIQTVVLDLRNNRGGDFGVAPVFANHLSMGLEKLFDIRQRQSDELCSQPQTQALCDPATLSFYEQLGVNGTAEVFDLPSAALSIFYDTLAGPQPTEKFSGEFCVLTSGITFSSAHLWVGAIQLNGLGRVVGTPTGNSPNFWGNTLQFEIPHTDLSLFLTTSLTSIAPESTIDDAIYPDELVPTTLDDIIAGRDSQLEWVFNHTSGADYRSANWASIVVMGLCSCSVIFVT